MASLSRFDIAKLLEPLGLRNTLIVLLGRDGYTVNRLKSLGQLPDLFCIGRPPVERFLSDWPYRLARSETADRKG